MGQVVAQPSRIGRGAGQELFDRLQELARVKADGLLDEEEFKAAKRLLLKF